MRALVTGAARGIGAAIVARLREDGVEVVTLDLAPGSDLQLDVARDELPEAEFAASTSSSPTPASSTRSPRRTR